MKLEKKTKHKVKSDPDIKTTCQKIAYPEGSNNLGQPHEAKWIHDLPTCPKSVDDLFPPIIWIFTEDKGDDIKSRLPFKTFSTLSDI